MPNPVPPTRSEAARFLSHAALGCTPSDIEAVRQQGYDTWITRQFSMWTQTGHWDWMVAYRPEQMTAATISSEQLEAATISAWRRFIEGRDLLRQKVVFALSEIVVASVAPEMAGYQEWGAANHLDIIERNAFGNYRNLLMEVSKSLLMGYYLTYRGSAAAGTLAGGANKPDENYARELMQLFTIGLNKLDPYGRPILVDGKPVPTYTQDDVATVARVFTGWETTENRTVSLHAHWRNPMVNITSRFDSNTKTFSTLADNTTLMPAIPAGGTADQALSQLIDGLMAHQNIGPFIGRMLIQRMVTSNPSDAYVGRVAAAFNNNGSGVKGDMTAVIRAILLDPDLFDADGHRTGGMQDETFGKLREPVVRIVQWAKAFNVKSKSGRWLIGGCYPLQLLGQRPMRSASVFNFFRPGYTPPPNTAISRLTVNDQPMVEPEFQITNEVTVLDYLSTIRGFIDNGLSTYQSLPVGQGITDVKADYTAWLPKASDPVGLVADLNVLLAAGQIGADTAQLIAQVIGSMPYGDTNGRTNRVKAAAFLIMSAPEYISQK